VLGAGLGAIIGNETGHAGPGIAIGAAAGALTGALVGNQLQQQDDKNSELAGEIDRQQGVIDENRRLIAELRGRGADVRESNRGVVVNLPDILFQFDSHRLTRDAVGTVGEIGRVIRDYRNRRILVEGHTDSVGSNSYNRDLSERRADSVAGELVDNGVPRSQVYVRGFGEERPIASNGNPAGRGRNRRVEVVIEN
jgi:outer membrane protein OmpA-like peptidoglycan-associated protein